MSKILVTGGAGFIGSNIVARLIKDGHTVIILDDLSSGHLSLVHPKASFIKGSAINDDDLANCFSHGPELVIHMAALFANQNSVDHPDTDLLVNGLGTIRVLESSKQASVQKFLYVSSSCVYGNKTEMEESDLSYSPDTPYAITKLLGERYSTFWAQQHGLNVVMVRLFNTFGPGEMPGAYRNVIPNFIAKALKGEPLPITGTGEETRDFTYVDDTVSGILAALFEKTEAGEVFNIATGRKTKIIDIAKIINTYLGNKGGVEFLPRRSWDHVTNRRADTTKALKILNFKASHGMQAGIHKTCDWIRDNYKL